MTAPMELPETRGIRPTYGNAVKNERLDWKAWQRFFKDAGYIADTTDDAPRDVLRALEHYAPQFQEWSEWRTRLRCRFPLELQKGYAMPQPHLGALHDAARIFVLRMRAHLAAGDSPAAYADFQDGFQTYRAFKDEPTLLSGVMRISKLALLCNAVGDGLRDRAWAEPEMRKLEADLASPHIWEDCRLSFASERGCANWCYDLVAGPSSTERTDLLLGLGATGMHPSSNAITSWMLIPRRVFRDNQLRQNQYLDEMLTRVSQDGRSFDPDGPLPSDPDNLTGLIDPYYFFLFRLAAPGFAYDCDRFVHLQTQLDEARIACVLERFRLVRGAYPERLVELVPDFIAELPVDTYSHQPLIYRRKDGGTFLLYGVGKNRTDDGGAVDPKHSETQQRDAIWLYAPPPSK